MNTWPSISYGEWKATYETLHRWLQIVGKLKLSKMPLMNHSWNSALYVTSRGLTTSSIILGERSLSVDFDFFDHKLIFSDTRGQTFVMALLNESVASFFKRFRNSLSQMGVILDFDPHPNECMDYIRFDEDIVHETYVREEAHKWFQALVRANNVLQIFRSKFLGKCSPVHFFWGSFDLAVTRFSGRLAPEHPGLAPHISSIVLKEAYSHEVSSAGFWPGNELYPHAAFYCYAYPNPRGFPSSQVVPKEAFYHQELGEFILPYDVVRNAENPEAMLFDFFQSTYVSAANLGDWDRERLEDSPFLQALQAKSRGKFTDKHARLQ